MAKNLNGAYVECSSEQTMMFKDGITKLIENVDQDHQFTCEGSAWRSNL